MAILLLLWIIIMSLILLRFMTLMTNLLSLRPLALPYPHCLIYPPLILLSALSMPWIFTFMRRLRLVLPSPHSILLIMSLLHTWTLGPWPVPLTVFLTCGIFSPSMVLPPLFVLLMPHPIIPLVLVTCVSPFSALLISPLFGRFTRPVSRQPLFRLLLLPLTLAVLDILALPISMAPVAASCCLRWSGCHFSSAASSWSPLHLPSSSTFFIIFAYHFAASSTVLPF